MTGELLRQLNVTDSEDNFKTPQVVSICGGRSRVGLQVSGRLECCVKRPRWQALSKSRSNGAARDTKDGTEVASRWRRQGGNIVVLLEAC